MCLKKLFIVLYLWGMFVQANDRPNMFPAPIPDKVKREKMILEKVSKEGYERIVLSRDGVIVIEDYFYNEEHKSHGKKSSSEHENDYLEVIANEYLEKGFVEVPKIGTLKNKNISQTIFVLSKKDFAKKYPKINIDYYFNWSGDIKVFEEDVVIDKNLDLVAQDYSEPTPMLFLKNLTVHGDIISDDVDTDCPIRVFGKTKAYSIISKGAKMYFNDVELTKSKKIYTNSETFLRRFGKLKIFAK